MSRSLHTRDAPIDPAAAGPPVPDLPGHGGSYTMRPAMLPPAHAESTIASVSNARVREFLRRQHSEALRIRGVIETNQRELRRMVGGENFILSTSARAGLSSDSTGLRGLITEAVFVPPDLQSLRALLIWCFRYRIPVIPYGAGSGYNMGVVPLAPAVTVWSACLRDIGRPRLHPSPRGRVTHVCSVGAGALYADVLRTAREHGLSLRCAPNSPRASVGGIVATGSNGGRRIGEVVVGGQAALADGSLARFVTAEEERRFWSGGVFPLIHKFSGAPREPGMLRRMIREGHDLPSTLFVGSEGITGLITSVDLEMESPAALACTMGVWLRYSTQVPDFVRSVHALGVRPTYFELLTEPAISRHLRTDFPDLFHGGEDAHVVLTFEDDDQAFLEELVGRVLRLVPTDGRQMTCGPYPSDLPPPSALRLMAPREELPKKLVSKCKTDIEVLLDALPRAIARLAQPRTAEGDPVESILFGHLSPGASAILHWNLGGVDLADEESAARGWRHIERVLEEVGSTGGSDLQAVFTGEHGAAGKPWLVRRVVSRYELARMAMVKRTLDPRGLFNRNKLILPTRIAKALRGRVLARAPEGAFGKTDDLRSRCTRCNACQNCPVLDAQIELRTMRRPRSRGGLLLGKRSLIHALELAAASDFDPADRRRLHEDARRGMQACIACGQCDRDCPASITLEEISSLTQRPIVRGSWRTDVLHRLFCAPVPRGWTMSAISGLQRAAAPVLSPARSSWMGTYAALPPLNGRRYAPSRHREPGLTADLAIVGDPRHLVRDGRIAVRFRGCVGTVGQAETAANEDLFFRSVGVSFLDFVPDLCCGFPFIASGDFPEGRRLRAGLMQRIVDAARSAQSVWDFRETVVISSCPTCQEALRAAQAENPAQISHLTVMDPAEYVAPGVPARSGDPGRPVALKAPCHATPAAVSAQQTLLRAYGVDPVPFHQCCGMAGTARLDHPEVGRVIARRLTSAISNKGLALAVSGCPSCRDGMRLQATLDRTELRILDIYGLLLEVSRDAVEG